MLKLGMVIKPELEILTQLEGANLVQYHLNDIHRHQKWKEQQNKNKRKKTHQKKQN